MPELSCWFQSSDFSSEELGMLTREAAVAAFRAVDFADEDRKMFDLEGRGDDFCNYGFGMNGDKGLLVHVCRKDTERNTFRVLLDVPVERNFLGLFRFTGKKSRCVDDVDLDQAVSMIEAAFDDPSSLLV